MPRVGMAIASVLVIASLTASSAFAAVTLKTGPTFTDNGLTLTVQAEVSGLGTGGTGDLTAQGLVTLDCINPGSGEHRPPGQNPQETTLPAPTVTLTTDTGGRAFFTTTTIAPTVSGAREAGCPNDRWIASVADVVFTFAKITVTPSGGGAPLVKCYTLSGSPLVATEITCP